MADEALINNINTGAAGNSNPPTTESVVEERNALQALQDGDGSPHGFAKYTRRWLKKFSRIAFAAALLVTFLENLPPKYERAAPVGWVAFLLHAAYVMIWERD